MAEKLTALSQAGVIIKLMHGNRDFLMGDKFAQACGAELIEEPYLLQAFNDTLLLMHGMSYVLETMTTCPLDLWFATQSGNKNFLSTYLGPHSFCS